MDELDLRPAEELRAEVRKLRAELKRRNESMGCSVVMCLGLLLAVPIVWVGKSYQEARTFKRLTGREVSTWDAMFVELRIDG